MNEYESKIIREEIKTLETNLMKQLHMVKRDVIGNNDSNTNIILSSPSKNNEVLKLVNVKSTTKGISGLLPLTEQEKKVGDIFEESSVDDKVQLETDTMILTVPQQTDLKLIVGQEANIVEFVSNYMSYLLPIIYNHYHKKSNTDSEHTQSVIKEVLK